MRLTALLIAAAAACLPLPRATAAEKPNIIYLLVDDMGFSDCGFNGGKDIRTPSIDALAARGSTFKNFYVQPLCSPTRASILTGRYPVHHGLYTALKVESKYGLPLEERTLAQGLHTAGYTTAIVGKWHVGESEPGYRPMQRGFDHQYGLWYGQLDYFTHVRGGRVDWYRDDQPCDDKGYTTHLIGQEAIRLLNEQPKDKPLFLYVPFNAVHAPYQVPDSYKEPYPNLVRQRRTLAGMLSALDEQVGKILAKVHDLGEDDNTLVLFSSDNGGVAPGRVTNNLPLRDGKGSIYEGGCRSCAAIAWPNHIPVGKKIDPPVHVVDWYPTLMHLTGADESQKLQVDGKDIWPLIANGTPPERDALLLGGTSIDRNAIRMGDWKLLVNPNNTAGRNPEDDGDEKPGANKLTGRVELYNLADDISETKDLSATQPDRVKTMRARLEDLLKDAVKVGGGGPAHAR